MQISCCLMYASGGYPKIASKWHPDIFRGVPALVEKMATYYVHPDRPLDHIMMIQIPSPRRQRGWQYLPLVTQAIADSQSFQYVPVYPSSRPLTPETSRLLLTPDAIKFHKLL